MLVSPAQLPTAPSSPKPARDAALGLMLGLALGLSFALVRERLDDRTADKDDLEREIGAPVMAIVPRVEGWRRRKTTRLVAQDEPMSIAAEGYRTARANILYLATTADIKAIAVTSAHLGEGKTTTAANLAVTLAQTGKRVIAVSCDLRKPRLHAFFGLAGEPGLVELLEGGATPSDVAQHAEISTLRVIASGHIPSNPAELLGSDEMARLLEQLRRASDFIILDTPPVLAVSDALMLARVADGVIVVADADSTTRSALRQTRERLEQLGCRIIGGIYNDFDPSGGKGRGYGYYHSYYSSDAPKNGGRDKRAAQKDERTPVSVDSDATESWWA